MISQIAFAQLSNYDGEGKNHPGSSEEVLIKVNKEINKIKSGSGNISFPGVIGGFLTIGMDVTKLILSTQEEKYTATYSSTKSETGLILLKDSSKTSSADLNIDSINIYRIFTKQDFSRETGCDIVLKPVVDPTTGLFRFQLQRLYMPYSKAKTKQSGKLGKTIDINITLKINCLWKEETAASDSNQTSGKERRTAIEKAPSFQIKSASLGESAITVSGVKPGGNFAIVEDYYSGWFQLLPSSALKFANAENKYSVGNYTITVTIKEANPYAVNSKKIADFFNGSVTDINSLIKQFFPTNSK